MTGSLVDPPENADHAAFGRRMHNLAATSRAGRPETEGAARAAASVGTGGKIWAAPKYLDLRYVNRLLALGDLASFALAGLVTSVALMGWGDLASTYVVFVAVGTFIFSRILTAADVYRTPANRISATLLRRLIQSILVTFALVAAAAFGLDLSEGFSREWLLAWLGFTSIGILGYRVGLAVVVRAAMRRGHLQRRVAVYGGDEQGAAVIEHLVSGDEGYYRLVGFYDDRHRRVPETIDGYDHKGDLADLEEAIERGLVEEVIIALPLSAVDRLSYIIERLSRYSVTVLLAPDLCMWRFFDRPFETVGGAPMLRTMETPIEGWGRIAKFLEDTVLASILVVVAAPVLALVALAIRLDSRGPVIFRQPRRGWNGSIFEIYKFRTMREDVSDMRGSEQARRHDPRVTRVGRFPRRTSLDELPQLFNVLKGDMSLVGPRPHALGTRTEGMLFEDAVTDYMSRYRVKPGITGWAQVNGLRGETDSSRKLLLRVRYDIEYIEKWSFWFDLYILAVTPLALIFRSDRAY